MTIDIDDAAGCQAEIAQEADRKDNLFNEIEDDPHPESYVWSPEQFKWVATEEIVPDEPDEPQVWTLAEFAAEHVEVCLQFWDHSNNEPKVRPFVFNQATKSFGDMDWVAMVCPEWIRRNKSPSFTSSKAAKEWLASHPDDTCRFDGVRLNLNLREAQHAFQVAWDDGVIVSDGEENSDLDGLFHRTVIVPRIQWNHGDLTRSTVKKTHEWRIAA